MQKDNLEQFILDNRANFDTASPNLKVWANIDQQLEGRPKKKPIWLGLSKIAAAVSLLIVGSILGYMLAQPQGNTSVLAASFGEFQDMTAFYERQLQDKTAKLASYQHQDKSVNQDLEQFDFIMKELKAELDEAPNGSEEKIIHAMIQNYQAKLFVLDRVLEQLNSSNEKHKKNGTVNL